MSTFYRCIVLAYLLLLKICHCQKHTNGVFIQADSAPFACVFLHLFLCQRHPIPAHTRMCVFFGRPSVLRSPPSHLSSQRQSLRLNERRRPVYYYERMYPTCLFWRGRSTGRWKRGGATMARTQKLHDDVWLKWSWIILAACTAGVEPSASEWWLDANGTLWGGWTSGRNWIVRFCGRNERSLIVCVPFPSQCINLVSAKRTYEWMNTEIISMNQAWLSTV